MNTFSVARFIEPQSDRCSEGLSHRELQGVGPAIVAEAPISDEVESAALY